MRLAGKAALVLGAGGAGNMGQAIARRFAAEGARVAVAARSVGAVQALAEEIGGVALAADIRDGAALHVLAADTIAAFGALDIAVDCTGINVMKPFLETTPGDLAQLFEGQMLGPFQFLQAMIAAMVPQGRGSIIRLSSLAGTILLDDYAAYGATKAGMDHVVRSVADEFGPQGIRVNTISPGAVRTPMTETVMALPAVEAVFAASSPLGRVASVDDIAAAALWLASDECFMTGANLQVSGGVMLRQNPSKAQVLAAIAQPQPGDPA